ncbi:MAG: alkaline phosphatase family protein [Candidatus Cloacimonetes bacterium]|nr:alkaline phosphatase family protein [Candidatus Cloacimonadota bacterium]
MKKRRISVFMFIDALGWEIVKKHHFMEELLPFRNKVEMQFGYSCTAIPTILTGERPEVHKHLSFYYYNPEESPFKSFKVLKFLPGSIFDRWRFRHLFSKVIAKAYRYTGYFEMYAMPFERLPYFDYIEKRDLFVPGGLLPVPNLADKLEEFGLRYHISNWRLTEEQNIQSLIEDVKKGSIDFGFLYTAAMDGLLHRVTREGQEVQQKLDWYAEHIYTLWQEMQNSYDEYNLIVISDHGMTTLTETVDAKKIVEALPLKFGKDYVAVYDSTMIHFWYFNDEARKAILKVIPTIPFSHLLNIEEKKRYGIDFKDNMYGEDIVLMDAGVQIAPSDMGRNTLPGMHGFAPEHEDSYASFLSSSKVEVEPQWVGDYFRVMLKEIERISGNPSL